MKKLALGTVGALAALFAVPQAAQAQFLSVGIGGPSYYGYSYYGDSGVSVGYGAPAYSYGYGYPYAVSSYGYAYDDFDDYYAAPVVTRRVVYRAPRTVVRTRVVSNRYVPAHRTVRMVRYY